MSGAMGAVNARDGAHRDILIRGLRNKGMSKESVMLPNVD